MAEILPWLSLALAALTLLLLLWLALRRPVDDGQQAALRQSLESLAQNAERQQRELRAELHGAARDTRAELTQTLSLFQQNLQAQAGEGSRTQNEQIDALRAQLATLQQQVAQALQHSTEALTRQAQASGEALTQSLLQTSAQLRES